MSAAGEKTMPIWFAWMDEYPDEGSVVVGATTAPKAASKAGDLFELKSGKDVTVRPVTEAWVEIAQEVVQAADSLLKVPGISPGPRGYESRTSRLAAALKSLSETP